MRFFANSPLLLKQANGRHAGHPNEYDQQDQAKGRQVIEYDHRNNLEKIKVASLSIFKAIAPPPTVPMPLPHRIYSRGESTKGEANKKVSHGYPNCVFLAPAAVSLFL